MAHLSMSSRDNEKIEVHALDREDDHAVALYIGSAYCVLYMSVEQAREVAEEILRATAPADAQPSSAA